MKADASILLHQLSFIPLSLFPSHLHPPFCIYVCLSVCLSVLSADNSNRLAPSRGRSPSPDMNSAGSAQRSDSPQAGHEATPSVDRDQTGGAPRRDEYSQPAAPPHPRVVEATGLATASVGRELTPRGTHMRRRSSLPLFTPFEESLESSTTRGGVGGAHPTLADPTGGFDGQATEEIPRARRVTGDVMPQTGGQEFLSPVLDEEVFEDARGDERGNARDDGDPYDGDQVWDWIEQRKKVDGRNISQDYPKKLKCLEGVPPPYRYNYAFAGKYGVINYDVIGKRSKRLVRRGMACQ